MLSRNLFLPTLIFILTLSIANAKNRDTGIRRTHHAQQQQLQRQRRRRQRQHQQENNLISTTTAETATVQTATKHGNRKNQEKQNFDYMNDVVGGIMGRHGKIIKRKEPDEPTTAVPLVVDGNPSLPCKDTDKNTAAAEAEAAVAETTKANDNGVYGLTSNTTGNIVIDYEIIVSPDMVARSSSASQEQERNGLASKLETEIFVDLTTYMVTNLALTFIPNLLVDTNTRNIPCSVGSSSGTNIGSVRRHLREKKNKTVQQNSWRGLLDDKEVKDLYHLGLIGANVSMDDSGVVGYGECNNQSSDCYAVITTFALYFNDTTSSPTSLLTISQTLQNFVSQNTENGSYLKSNQHIIKITSTSSEWINPEEKTASESDGSRGIMEGGNTNDNNNDSAIMGKIKAKNDERETNNLDKTNLAIPIIGLCTSVLTMLMIVHLVVRSNHRGRRNFDNGEILDTSSHMCREIYEVSSPSRSSSNVSALTFSSPGHISGGTRRSNNLPNFSPLSSNSTSSPSSFGKLSNAYRYENRHNHCEQEQECQQEENIFPTTLAAFMVPTFSLLATHVWDKEENVNMRAQERSGDDVNDQEIVQSL